jgi:hypothetical protein
MERRDRRGGGSHARTHHVISDNYLCAHCEELGVTIARVIFVHLMFQFVLAWSGWRMPAVRRRAAPHRLPARHLVAGPQARSVRGVPLSRRPVPHAHVSTGLRRPSQGPRRSSGRRVRPDPAPGGEHVGGRRRAGARHAARPRRAVRLRGGQGRRGCGARCHIGAGHPGALGDGDDVVEDGGGLGGAVGDHRWARSVVNLRGIVGCQCLDGRVDAAVRRSHSGKQRSA